MNLIKWMVPIVQIFFQPSHAFYHMQSMKSVLPPTLPNGSNFGYSVAYQPQIRSLVISAPQADAIGHVYTYDIERHNLTKVDFEPESELNATSLLLGATVKAGRSFYTTCAPRRLVEKNETDPVNKNIYTHDGTFARCFTQTSENGGEIIPMPELSPSDRSIGTVNFEQKTDSFGWSIDITVHDNVLIGGAAMFKGRVIQYKNISDVPQSILPPNINMTKGKLDFFNFGYGIASGNFFSDNPDNISYAISTPYGSRGVGQILFYEESGEYIESLSDTESGLGTIFGAVLCTVRLNSKRASLLVGAPAFVPEDTTFTDLGAVHIYMPDDKSLAFSKTIKGTHSGGRFGTAIINIGDLDADQLDDVAIAAPYESEGRGAVYIFTARSILTDKIDIEYLQKIEREEFKSFGLSIAPLQDYDGNGCNALAIGAPESNAVVVLSCLSSIIVNIFTVVPNLQNRGSAERDKFVYKSCINVLFQDKPKDILADIAITLNIMHPSSIFNETKNGVLSYKVTLNKTTNIYCKDIEVLTPLDKNIELYPIQITVKADMADDPTLLEDFDSRRVVLSKRSSLFAVDKVWVSECNFTYCAPNVSTVISTSFPSLPYTIGSSDVENIILNVTNIGETAYNPCLRVQLDNVRALQAPECRRDGGILICEPGSPLKSNDYWDKLKITLETKVLTSRDEIINIKVDTYNHCDNETDKTTEELKIDLEPDISNLILMSEAIPAEVVNISSANLETEISHLYSILNNGLTNWFDIKSEIILNSTYVEIKNPIFIHKDSRTEECYAKTNTTVCFIGEIKKTQKIYIMVNLRVPPMSSDEFAMDRNISTVTLFNLMLKSEVKTLSTTSTLVSVSPPEVAFWIYLCAGFLALLVLIITVVIFYECGFLQRKDKVRLRDLKKDVRRQSHTNNATTREYTCIRSADEQYTRSEKLVEDTDEDNSQMAENKNNADM